MDIRTLTKPEELDACVALQKSIWGLDDTGVTSPITLTAVSMATPPVGLITGAWDGDALVGFFLALGTMEPGVAYFHMLGVAESQRGKHVGTALMDHSLDILHERGIHELVLTYEPLESRNAHLYLNRYHGHAFAYDSAHFHARAAMHEGLPLDRLVARIPVGTTPAQNPSENRAKTPAIPPEGGEQLPEATPEHMPEAEAVRVKIPSDLGQLKARDMEAARRYRQDTRVVLTEYLNHRGYRAIGLIGSPGKDVQGESHYVLTRATPS